MNMLKGPIEAQAWLPPWHDIPFLSSSASLSKYIHDNQSLARVIGSSAMGLELCSTKHLKYASILGRGVLIQAKKLA